MASLTFSPLQAAMGGAFLGTASGLLMLFSGKIAGNSGALKSLVLGEFDVSKTAFLGGLLAAGAFFVRVMPSAFEAAPAPSLGLFAGGVATGLGTALANGCTSGHGLCGCARLSPRSFVAVPIFMFFAAFTTNVRAGTFKLGEFAPLTQPAEGSVSLAAMLAAVFLATLPLVFMLTTKDSHAREAAVGAWVGLSFGTGLSLGGMSKASVVTSAFSLSTPNLTLWVLFFSGLTATFLIYRVAEHYMKVPQAIAPSGGRIDARLMVGSAIFGIGWGATGFCPGPLLVNLGATPMEPTILLTLAGIVTGILSSNLYGQALDTIMNMATGQKSQGAVKC